MRPPETRYAKTRDVSIAYQVIGQGSLDLLLIPGFISNLDVLWEDPGFGHLVKRLSTFARLILMDPCGTGLSDRGDPAHPPDLHDRVSDALAVLDATGSGRTALLATSSGVATAIRFSTTHPNRTRALALYAGFSHLAANAMDARRLEALEAVIDRGWGKGATIAHVAPDRVHDQRFVEWWSRFERLSVSPEGARSLLRMATTIDVRAELPVVPVPVLVIARTDDAYIRINASRNLARDIPGARLVECPGRDHPIWMGDVDRLVDEIAEFLTGERPVVTSNQVLAVVLVSRIGGRGRETQPRPDPMFTERLERFRDAAPKVVEQAGGRSVWLDDALLLTWYPGVSRAVAAAVRLRDLAGTFELSLGQGLQVGELYPEAALPVGLLRVVAERLATAAHPDEILLTQLVSEMVTGSGVQFVAHAEIGGDGLVKPVPVVRVNTERHLEPVFPRTHGADLLDLSPREREVLVLIADGLSNPLIAMRLGLSEHTVKRHVANILLKLDLPTRSAAAGLVARETRP